MRLVRAHAADGHAPVSARNWLFVAQDIRSQMAAEFVQDLRSISEENSLLLR
jgi:hypothetical protein